MRGFWTIVKNEFRAIFKDEGAFLILVGALVIYSALYGTIYAPEVVRKIPVAVVDMDKTEASAKMIRMLNATPQASVEYVAPTLNSAKELFYARNINGILYIPEGFEANGIKGLQSHVSVYADGSYFMLYTNFLNAAANVIFNNANAIQIDRFVENGLDQPRAQAIAKPLEYKIEMLANPYSGYATALLPAVLILLLQQVIMIGIGMVMGTQSEFNKYKIYDGFSSMTVTLGKLGVTFVIYIPLIFYLLWFNYRFWGYPMNGNDWELILFLLPYLLSVIFAGISFGGLMHKRESSILYLAAFSVFFIMISGISWPREGMADWLFILGKILPSSSAIEGWTAMRTGGASLADVWQPFTMLWVLTLVYGATAFWSVNQALKRIK